MAADLDIQNDHNFAIGLPIDVMFGSRVGFSAELKSLRQGPSHTHCCLCCRALTFASARLSSNGAIYRKSGTNRTIKPLFRFMQLIRYGPGS